MGKKTERDVAARWERLAQIPRRVYCEELFRCKRCIIEQFYGPRLAADNLRILHRERAIKVGVIGRTLAIIMHTVAIFVCGIAT